MARVLVFFRYTTAFCNGSSRLLNTHPAKVRNWSEDWGGVHATAAAPPPFKRTKNSKAAPNARRIGRGHDPPKAIGDGWGFDLGSSSIMASAPPDASRHPGAPRRQYAPWLPPGAFSFCRFSRFPLRQPPLPPRSHNRRGRVERVGQILRDGRTAVPRMGGSFRRDAPSP